MEMAFRIEKRVIAIIAGVVMSPALFAQQSFEYEAWHGHSRPPHIKKAGGLGTLTISDAGVSFQEKYKDGRMPKHPHDWRWDYPDIQQLKVTPRSLTVLTYTDNKWKFGADREFEFELVDGKTLNDVYNVLKRRLDQRFVAAIAESPSSMLWEMPVKHMQALVGDEGKLQVGADAITFQSARTNQSRAWRYEDIDNISSSGPFQLTITTFEHARTQYGGRKSFEFELKQRLEEDRYNDLWLRLNQAKGLKVLTSYREAGGPH
jgi:hypothetical protein